jgi:hypothetical protein
MPPNITPLAKAILPTDQFNPETHCFVVRFSIHFTTITFREQGARGGHA